MGGVLDWPPEPASVAEDCITTAANAVLRCTSLGEVVGVRANLPWYWFPFGILVGLLLSPFFDLFLTWRLLVHRWTGRVASSITSSEPAN